MSSHKLMSMIMVMVWKIKI